MSTIEPKGSDPLGIKDLILYTVIVAAILLRLAPAAFASSTVVINEICPACDPEWVELYNNSGNTINLENWLLKDGNSNPNDDITLSNIIQPNSFLVFDHNKGWLNDNAPGDSITLIDNNGNTIDSYSYSSTTNNKTFSRFPDGIGNFQEDTTATKNSANQALPTSTPTPSPSPTPTPTPEPTPKPSSTPKPATATPVPSNTPTPTSTPTSILTSTANNPSPQVLAETDENPQPKVNLEIIDLTATAESETNPSPTPPTKPNSLTSPVFVISAVGAALMLAGGIPLFIQEINRRKK